MPCVAFPVLGDTDGCRDLENESDNRNGRTWGRHTERKMGKAPRKEVSINKAVSHTHEHEHGPNHDRACPLALKWASGSQTFPFSGGLAGYLWSVCVLVMIAAGGCDYCSQTTRSRKKAKVPLTLKLKNYNTVFKWKCFWRLAICCGRGCEERLNETKPSNQQKHTLYVD